MRVGVSQVRMTLLHALRRLSHKVHATLCVLCEYTTGYSSWSCRCTSSRGCRLRGWWPVRGCVLRIQSLAQLNRGLNVCVCVLHACACVFATSTHTQAHTELGPAPLVTCRKIADADAAHHVRHSMEKRAHRRACRAGGHARLSRRVPVLV